MKKTLHERYEEAKALNEDKDPKYTAYFNKMLKKYDVKSPADLSDEDKTKFYDEVDKGWEADNETDEALVLDPNDTNTKELQGDDVTEEISIDEQLEIARQQYNVWRKVVEKLIKENLK